MEVRASALPFPLDYPPHAQYPSSRRRSLSNRRPIPPYPRNIQVGLRDIASLITTDAFLQTLYLRSSMVPGEYPLPLLLIARTNAVA